MGVLENGQMTFEDEKSEPEGRENILRASSIIGYGEEKIDAYKRDMEKAFTKKRDYGYGY